MKPSRNKSRTPGARRETLVSQPSLCPLALLVGLLALLLAAPGCSRDKKPRSPKVPVTMAQVQKRDVPLVLEATGTVEASQTVAIQSQVGGLLLRVAFREGDEVQAGQLLFEIDPRPLRAAADQARAALARDKAQAESARLDAERAQQLVDANYISRQEFDQKTATAAALQATVRADSAFLATARLSLDYATIRAPITGRTGNLMVHAGNLIKAADIGNPLVTLNQTRPIRVRFALPEPQLPQVLKHRSRGLKVLVHARDDSTSVEGELTFVDNAVDPSTGTILLKAEYPNRDGALWPGEFVDARLVLYVQPGASVVPVEAVTNGPNGSFVYVVGADTTANPRPVVVGRSVDGLAVISSGLVPGEWVVTDGQMRLSPGSRVAPRGAPGAGGAAHGGPGKRGGAARGAARAPGSP